MELEVFTPAGAEVVSTSDMKAALRVDGSDEDTLIASICIAARQKAEDFTSRRFITQTLRLWFDDWPRNNAQEPWWDGVLDAPVTILDRAQKREIDLKLAPIQSISSVKYYGTDDTEYTMTATDYVANLVSVPPRLVLGYGKSWPSTTLRPTKAVAVQFVAGYGAAGSAVPDSIVLAIKQIGARLYEHRGDADCGASCEIPAGARMLLDPYVIKRL